RGDTGEVLHQERFVELPSRDVRGPARVCARDRRQAGRERLACDHRRRPRALIMKARKGPPDLALLERGIRAGERAVLARAITLLESKRADHQTTARALVQSLLPLTGRAVRVGITGAPGVGKSTTIDALGSHLTGTGHRVAVLAVDPSSARTGGSILADKTRMARPAPPQNPPLPPPPPPRTLRRLPP